MEMHKEFGKGPKDMLECFMCFPFALSPQMQQFCQHGANWWFNDPSQVTNKTLLPNLVSAHRLQNYLQAKSGNSCLFSNTSVIWALTEDVEADGSSILAPRCFVGYIQAPTWEDGGDR